MKNLDELCEILAPVSTAGKISSTNSAKKEPNKPEIGYCRGDNARFGTQNER